MFPLRKVFENIGDGMTRLMAGGKPEEALEQAIYGEVAHEYEVQNQHPLITNTDFYDLLKDINLDFLVNDVTPGEYKAYLLGETDSPRQIALGIQAHKIYPHAEISIEGRMMETRIIIRQNKETELFQLDDAYIAEISNEYLDPNWEINTDERQIAADTLNEFLPIFVEFAKEIYDAPDDNDPTDIEVRLSKALKPIMDKINIFGEQKYREYQQEIAAMGKPDPLAPTRK